MKIHFENSSLIILEKPFGVSFHSENEEGFMAIAKRSLDLSLYSVHRLDKVTSGLIIFAKSNLAASKLGNLFQQKKINKTYLALAPGKPSKKQGIISGDMEKSRRGTYKLLRSKENPAITKFTSSFYEEGYRVYTLSPLTGKTHQLRVMMKSLGVPILGDTSYGGKDYSRVCLHAHKLEFEYDGDLIMLESYPEFLDKKKHLN